MKSVRQSMDEACDKGKIRLLQWHKLLEQIDAIQEGRD
jgi:hypothetical protein